MRLRLFLSNIINYHQQIRICKWFVLPTFVAWTNKQSDCLITEDNSLVDIRPVSSVHANVLLRRFNDKPTCIFWQVGILTRTASSPTKNANALFYGWSVRPIFFDEIRTEVNVNNRADGYSCRVYPSPANNFDLLFMQREVWFYTCY